MTDEESTVRYGEFSAAFAPEVLGPSQVISR
jgi:hypothetical protein